MHLEKYKRGNVSGVIQHDERSIENHTNEQIDPTRSHLNYNLAEGNPLDNYNRRMDEVFCINRKNINTLASLCVTAPNELKQEDQERFFEEVFDYYSKKFGIENVVSAFVHLDETTPHIHFKFIPVYEQTKTTRKGEVYTRQAVSFDEVCPRKFYQTSHKDLQTHMDKTFGYHLGIINGKTKGVPTVKALKELNQLENKIEELKQAQEQLMSIEVEPRKKLKVVDPIEKGLITKEKFVPYEDYQKACKLNKQLLEDKTTLINQKHVLEADKGSLQRDLNKIKATDLYQENIALKSKIRGLETELSATQKENRVLTDENSILKQFKELVIKALRMIETQLKCDLDNIRIGLGLPKEHLSREEQLLKEWEEIEATPVPRTLKEQMERARRKADIKNELTRLGRADDLEIEHEHDYGRSM